MEARLQHLQSDKYCVSDMEDLTSDDSSHAVPFNKNAFQGLFPFKSASRVTPTTVTGTVTTGYSSSLPSSPSRINDEFKHRASNSLSSSPTSNAKTHPSSVQVRPPNDIPEYSRVLDISDNALRYDVDMSPKVRIQYEDLREWDCTSTILA